MKRILFIVLIFSSLLQSCQTNKYVIYTVSIVDDLYAEYKGKTKNYIIDNFPIAITDIKHLDEQYDILLFERNVPLLGTRYTYFYMKNGTCYQIKTNELKTEKRLERVSFFDSVFGN